MVFAIFAAGTIAMLLRDSSIAARIGRRGTMLGAAPETGATARLAAKSQPADPPRKVRLPVPAAAGTLFLLVGLGVAVSGWALLGRRGSQVRT